MNATCDDSSRGDRDSPTAYGIKIEEGSRDVLVEANDVRLDANREWVYGAVANARHAQRYLPVESHRAYTSGDYRNGGPPLERLFRREARTPTRLVAEQKHGGERDGGRIVSESSHGTSYGATSSMWNMSSESCRIRLPAWHLDRGETPMKPRSRECDLTQHGESRSVQITALSLQHEYDVRRDHGPRTGAWHGIS